MPKVRTGADQKWSRNASQATPSYVAGVQSPRQSWSQSTQAAKEAYKQGVQQAASEGRFEKGVAKAGDQKWQKGAVEKGEQRFAQGVQGATNDYASGVAPYTQVIESTTLPPRYPAGDPRNLERVKVMSTALRNKKVKS